MKTIAAIDIGTTHTKGCLVNNVGDIVASIATNTPAPIIADNEGLEHDAERHWWEPFSQTLRQLLNAVPESRSGLTGVFVSGMWPTFLVTNDDMLPLRNAMLYSDPRPARRQLLEEVRPTDCVEGFEWGPRLQWLRSEHFEVWKATRKVFTTHSYIVGRLTGRYVLDYHTALCLGSLYNPLQASWSSEVVDRLGARHIGLPDVLRPGAVAGSMSEEIKAQFGLAGKSVSVAVGIGDTFVSLLSAGINQPGDTVLYGGTVGHLIKLKEDYRRSILSLNKSRDEERITWLALFANMGSDIEWTARLIDNQAPDIWSSLQQRLWNSSMRSSGYDNIFFFKCTNDLALPSILRRDHGCLTGLRADSNIDDIIFAVIEYFSFATREAIENDLATSERPRDPLLLGGGIFKTQAIVSHMANAVGMSCLLLHDSDSAIGGALILGDELGLFNMDSVQTRRRAKARLINTERETVNRYTNKYKQFLAVRASARDGHLNVY
jgi:xylulokinase